MCMYLFVYLSICMSVYLSLPLSPSFSLSDSSSFCLPPSLPSSLPQSVCLCMSVSAYACVRICARVYVWVRIYISTCVKHEPLCVRILLYIWPSISLATLNLMLILPPEHPPIPPAFLSPPQPGRQGRGGGRRSEPGGEGKG